MHAASATLEPPNLWTFQACTVRALLRAPTSPPCPFGTNGRNACGRMGDASAKLSITLSSCSAAGKPRGHGRPRRCQSACGDPRRRPVEPVRQPEAARAAVGCAGAAPAHRQRRRSSSGSRSPSYSVRTRARSHRRCASRPSRSSSIATGGRHRQSRFASPCSRRRPRSSALLLLLADQVGSHGRRPQAPARGLASASDPDRRRAVRGAPGLPAIFPRWAFGDLLSLRGDARSAPGASAAASIASCASPCRTPRSTSTRPRTCSSSSSTIPVTRRTL